MLDSMPLGFFRRSHMTPDARGVSSGVKIERQWLGVPEVTEARVRQPGTPFPPSKV